jgi:competence protein ComEA
VAGLLAAPGGGWVPPEDVPAASAGDLAPASADPAVPDRSWAERAPGAHLAAGRFRLDPGRRGAVALVLAAALAAVVAGGLLLRNRPQEVPVPVVEAAGVPLPGASPSEAAGGQVVVSVSGKVRRPGLVRLPVGSRVDDAVRAAGGPVGGADVTALNLARRLVDGEQVLVGVGPPPGAGAAGAVAGGLLDLNAASASDLDALPGIGPVLAQRIVDWRTANGRFASVDQLREVTGIGEAT